LSQVGIRVVTLTRSSSTLATVGGAAMRTHSFASAAAGSIKAARAATTTERIGVVLTQLLHRIALEGFRVALMVVVGSSSAGKVTCEREAAAGRRKKCRPSRSYRRRFLAGRRHEWRTGSGVATVLVSVKVTGLLVAVVAASLVAASSSASLSTGRPGTVRYSWSIVWPDEGREQFFTRKFKSPPGLIRRVTVLIGGRRVGGPPYLSPVACIGTRTIATAQKSWLWNARSVFVSLLLSPGQCHVGGSRVRVRVFLTTVGT
jgi:hypothetical protein